ncbi:hypothetical protein ACIB24_09280 [Spongisporangium articulatum]|uniref:Uncharacterized protein n=1 Tax=Spongisporangium articulatum TaxID=3362603 RepID=A0ABW8ANR7_9ACTN
MSEDRVGDSTVAEVKDASEIRRGLMGRRAALVVLLVVVLAGATGLLGVHTSTARASGGGYSIALDYARVSRAGLDSPWKVTVTRADGFDGELTLATSSTYFEMFETQGFSPEPDSETAAGGVLYQTFAPPEGATSFTVAYDAYIQPASQRGRTGRTTLIVDGREVTHVDYRTWLVP